MRGGAERYDIIFVISISARTTSETRGRVLVVPDTPDGINTNHFSFTLSQVKQKTRYMYMHDNITMKLDFICHFVSLWVVSVFFHLDNTCRYNCFFVRPFYEDKINDVLCSWSTICDGICEPKQKSALQLGC